MCWWSCYPSNLLPRKLETSAVFLYQSDTVSKEMAVSYNKYEDALNNWGYT